MESCGKTDERTENNIRTSCRRELNDLNRELKRLNDK